MARLNLIHEEGMRPSYETGRVRIVWAFGPGVGEHNPMPQVKTGPRKTGDRIQFRPFTPEDIQRIWARAAEDPPIFLELLNASHVFITSCVFNVT